MSAIRKFKNKLEFFKNHPLAKKDPLGVAYKYIYFHLYHIFFPKPKPYQLTNRIKIFVAKDMEGVRVNVYTGLADFEEVLFMLHLLRENDVFLDVGANVGVYSLLAAGVCGSRVLAIEPVPLTFQQLLENVQLNRLDNIVCINSGLADKKGIMRFSDDLGARNCVVEGATEGVLVSIDTLDAIVSKHGIIPKLIKIDVEGYELPVLNGGLETISTRSCQALIVELNGSGTRYGFSDNAVHSLIVSKGYVPVSYEPFKRQLTVLTSYRKDNYNTIYVRNPKSIQKELEIAPKIKVGRFSV